MKTILGKSDTDLKSDVLAELKYEPSVKVTDIGVLVKDGTVTLNGFATSYGEKWNAVRATQRVTGVRAVADDIEVQFEDSSRRTDGDIAAAAAARLDWTPSLPEGAVKITVSNGWVTLAGEVEWWYQKNAAQAAVQHLTSVKGVSNQITIKPTLIPGDIKAAILSAFERNALLDADKIKVEVSGNKITLRGDVRNHDEQLEAERAAWAAPGVLSVDNKLKVEWSWLAS